MTWVDRGFEPTQQSDPAYPQGKDMDGANRALPYCSTKLPYPAKRCGYHHLICNLCGLSVAVSTAGRPDDPRSLTVNCKPMARA
jgi:hypothetical protein